MKKLIYGLARLVFRFFPHKPIVTANIQRILVVKLCCIGDILFTTPMLRALKQTHDRSIITYMSCSWCRELAAADRHVTDVIEFNAYDKVSLFEKIKRARRAIREIRKKQFDVAIVLHRTPLAGLLTALAGVPVRIGFDWEGAGFTLTHRVPFRADAHEIDRHMDCLKPLDIYSNQLSPEMNPPAAAEEAARAFLSQHGFQDGGDLLIAVFPAGGVNPGTKMVTKRWHIPGYREVCAYLVKEYRARILLVGNRDDAVIGDYLLTDQPWADRVIRSEGHTSLLQLAALLKKCELFIGGDSGPLHMADSVGIPTVSIFGPTDPKLLAPRGEQHHVIHKALSCAPCYNPITVRQKDVTVCRKKNVSCMQDVTAAEVIRAVDEALSLKGYDQQ